MTLEHRKHFIVPFPELAERLGIDGEILHVWREDDNDYLHVSAVNPDWLAIRPGSYVSPEIITAPERTVISSVVGTRVEVEELPFEARKVIEDMKGKEVGWLMNRGDMVVAERTTLRFGAFEVPRVFAVDQPETLPAMIARFEEALKMRVHTIVRWEGGEMNGETFPPALGAVFTA